MAKIPSPIIAIAACLALAACGGQGNFLSAPDGANAPGAAAVAQPAKAAAPSGPSKTASDAPPTSAPTVTFVGRKIQDLRHELARVQQTLRDQKEQLRRIRARAAGSSRDYFMAVADINSRLQAGTTRGNPMLIAQWNTAQARLARIDNDIAELNMLATRVAGTSTMASYLLQTTRAAYGLSGAVEEDHRQLAILEDEVSRLGVTIDRLLNEVSEDVNRQINYVSGERSNLTTLAAAIKNGELLGANLRNRARAAIGRRLAAAPGRPRTAVASEVLDAGPDMAAGADAEAADGRRPLVVIRFDRPDVPYEQALYNAVSSALERKPSAAFDLVAIAPKKPSPAQMAVASNTSKRNAETVLRSLAEMGLPRERVSLSALVSDRAHSNEVRVYVR